jgi:hypothetical protein
MSVSTNSKICPGAVAAAIASNQPSPTGVVAISLPSPHEATAHSLAYCALSTPVVEYARKPDIPQWQKFGP